MKVVINQCFGGFGLSDAAMQRYKEIKGIKSKSKKLYDHDISRDDPALIQVIEELGEAANGGYADLSVIVIPDDVKYTIEDYDGSEHIAEVHRTWG